MGTITQNVMAYAIVLAFASATHGQDQRRIGFIDFFGYSGLDLQRVRSALPIQEGDIYLGPGEAIPGIQKAVSSLLGRPPTDISTVCCDGQGRYIIFIGLPGDSIIPIKLRPVPRGSVRLPPEIVELYEDTMEALSADVLRGNPREDTSKGYALSTSDHSLRTKQLAARSYAIRHGDLIRRVLESSSETQQRIVAAHLLGYARQSQQQIASLADASRDPDGGVRNNATRALGALAASGPKVAARIPADGFIELLGSGSWSDRNKAGWLLSSLTRSRDRKLLGKLRSRALVPLIETARWRSTGHAYNARIVLGRIAGIAEERLLQLVNADNVDEIVKALEFKR